MKTRFICQNCGASSPKWLGRCPNCGAFNTMVEETIEKKTAKPEREPPRVISLSEVPMEQKDRTSTGLNEFDQVLGGGLVRGSLILLGGDPGIGKSTLMLQVSSPLAENGASILYVSGEESAHQVKLRARRLGIKGDNIKFLAETDIDAILDCAENLVPDLMVIDSIQTVFSSELSSAPGSVGQVRECGARIMRFAKKKGVTTVIIGHVTKFGMIAGPKTLEHIVDTVLYFEGDKTQQYRILRAIKNRFGSTNEIGVFEMSEFGLKEVANPSRLFISGSRNSGSAIITVIEGSRPLLVEVQALTSPSVFNYPQRVTSGVDYKRLAMLIAVLERRLGIGVARFDCFVNAVGGIRVFEPACDLGIILAIASSIKNIPIDEHIVIIGEVGLGGEVRPVFNIESRIKEAEKLGFQMAIIPDKNSFNDKGKIEVLPVNEVKDAVKIALGI